MSYCIMNAEDLLERLLIVLVFLISRLPFGGVTVKDVDAHEFVKAFAAH